MAKKKEVKKEIKRNTDSLMLKYKCESCGEQFFQCDIGGGIRTENFIIKCPSCGKVNNIALKEEMDLTKDVLAWTKDTAEAIRKSKKKK